MPSVTSSAAHHAGPGQARADHLHSGRAQSGHPLVCLPAVSVVVWHVLRYLTEVAIVPGALFYVVFSRAGLRPALLAALAWASVAVVRRLLTRQRVPATLLLSLALLAARTTVSWLSGSVFLYFLQPTLTTFLTACVLLGSLRTTRPFVQRALEDYVPGLPTFTGQATVTRFFRRCSVLWACMYLLNGAGTTWALFTTELGPFMLISKVGGGAITLATITVSIVWFLRSLRADGVTVVFGAAGLPDPGPTRAAAPEAVLPGSLVVPAPRAPEPIAA